MDRVNKNFNKNKKENNSKNSNKNINQKNNYNKNNNSKNNISNRNNNRKKYLIKQFTILFILLIWFISAIVIFAKYVTNSAQDFFMRSKEFYFYSDKLSENTSVFEVDNWSGVDDYNITIDMNSRKNNLEKTSYDIEYSVKANCETNNAIVQLSKTSGIIYANTNSDIFNLTITPNTQLNVGDKVTVDVQAESLGNYKKTLKGKFTLVVGKEQLSYEIEDSAHSQLFELKITNTLTYYNISENFGNCTKGQKIDINTYSSLTDDQKKKCYSALVTIKFDPNVVLFDLTNEEYHNATNIEKTAYNGTSYISSITFPIEPISSNSVRFYKIDTSKDYTYPNSTGTNILTISSK